MAQRTSVKTGSLLAAVYAVLLDSGHNRAVLQGEPFLGGPAARGPWGHPGVPGNPHLVCWGAVQEARQPDGPVLTPHLWLSVSRVQVSNISFCAFWNQGRIR